MKFQDSDFHRDGKMKHMPRNTYLQERPSKRDPRRIRIHVNLPALERPLQIIRQIHYDLVRSTVFGISEPNKTRSTRRGRFESDVVNELGGEVSRFRRCGVVGPTINNPSHKKEEMIGRQEIVREEFGDVPSAPAALRASLAERPTGQEVKEQSDRGKSGKKPYPPSAFPVVVISLHVSVEDSEDEKACRRVGATSDQPTTVR